MLSREQRIDEFIPPMSSSGYSFSSSPTVDSQFSPASRGFNHKPDGDPFSVVLSRSSAKDLEVPLHSVAREQFAAFCRHNRKSLCLMHPGFTADQIDRLLLIQWSELDATEKSIRTGCTLKFIVKTRRLKTDRDHVMPLQLHVCYGLARPADESVFSHWTDNETW